MGFRVGAFVAGVTTLALTESLWAALGIWFSIEVLVVVRELRRARS